MRIMKKKCAAIVLAAGKGSRMKAEVKKQFLLLGGKPILYYSLHTFENSPLIDEIVLVTSEDALSYCHDEVVSKYGFAKVKNIVPGGKERYHSVYEGLKACPEADYVFIHDSARPFLTEEIIARGYKEAVRSGACIVGVPSKDTVKIADDSGCVAETPPREKVWIIQTPQIFKKDLVLKAYESILSKNTKGITDDAMVVERETNMKIHLVEGSYKNIKITTPEDLKLAEAFLE